MTAARHGISAMISSRFRFWDETAPWDDETLLWDDVGAIGCEETHRVANALSCKRIELQTHWVEEQTHWVATLSWDETLYWDANWAWLWAWPWDATVAWLVMLFCDANWAWVRTWPWDATQLLAWELRTWDGTRSWDSACNWDLTSPCDDTMIGWFWICVKTAFCKFSFWFSFWDIFDFWWKWSTTACFIRADQTL